MYRYFVIVWHPSDPSQSAAARALSGRLQAASTQWCGRIARPGLLAFDSERRESSSEAHVLPGGAGVLFGKVFARVNAFASPQDLARAGPRSRGAPANEATASVDLLRVAKACGEGPRTLTERIWGRYVAVFDDPAGAWVLRDPSGALPCFTTCYRGAHVFFSDFEDCLALGLLSFTVNWDLVAAMVANSALHVRETGLREVSELLPGECARVLPEGLGRAFAWHPLDVASQEPIEDVRVATQLVHDTTHDCMQAWAGCYDGVLHSLSGGLDSSIVAACLASDRGSVPFTCLNYYAAGPEEDERRYARIVATHLSAPLIERELTADIALHDILGVRHTPRPGFYFAALPRQRLEAQLAGVLHADAIFSGGGGDALFYQARADLAVVDAIHRHGLGSQVWQAAMDAAQVTGLSVWALLQRALYAAMLNREWDPFDGAVPHSSLVSAEVVSAARRDPRWRHPWLESAQGVPHGTLWHALSLSVPPGFYDSFDAPQDPERTYPLLSQPLVELCLRVPTYRLIAGGVDRALARRAFAAELPPQIVQRRSKGGINDLSMRILDANLLFVRETLLDGHLVREGILDRARLERTLSGRPDPRSLEYNEILHDHLSIEAWLRRGNGLKARAAA